MEQPVLVTFATRYGSTAVTAQAVAQTLRHHGLSVEIRPINEVESLESFGAVVVGAALYMGRLHKDARRFLARQREALTKIPVALFVPGPIETREKDFDAARKQLEKELARFLWLTPVACEVVGGTFDTRKLGFPWKIIPAMRKIPASDARDWVTIRRWAENLAAMLQAHQQILGWTREQPSASSSRK